MTHPAIWNPSLVKEGPMVALAPPDLRIEARSVLDKLGHESPSDLLVDLVASGMATGALCAVRDYVATGIEAGKVADQGDAITAAKLARREPVGD